MTVFSLVLLVVALTAGCMAAPGYHTGIHDVSHGGITGTFFHISDLHLDPFYPRTSFSHGRDLGLVGGSICTATSSTDPKYGWYGCDAPGVLVELALQEMAGVDPNPEFILITGDLVGHHLGSEEINNDTIMKAASNITTVFPNTDILAGLGNNDVYPDYGLCAVIDSKQMADLATAYGSLIPENGKAQFKSTGYYAHTTSTGIRVLMMNTIVWSRRFTNTCPDDQGDLIVDAQWTWLEAELKAAKTAGTSVLLAGHIPPIGDEFSGKWLYDATANYTETYFGLVDKYAEVIVGQFFGHQHRDLFSTRSTTPSPSSTVGAFAGASASDVVVLTASVTPVYNNNPTFRVVYVGAAEGKLPAPVDYDDFVFDIAASAMGQKTSFTPEYNFRSTFGVPGMGTDSYKSVLARIKNDPDAWAQWISHRVGLYTDRKCQATCVISNSDPTEFTKCMDSCHSA